MTELDRAKAFVTDWVERHRDAFSSHAKAIWEFPELGCEEVRSSRLLAGVLREHGFEVELGVAGIPTAFVARAGRGAPTIAFSAEYDALPGLSQQAAEPGAAPRQVAEVEGAPGHGCGHNLLGVGGALAAIAVRRWLEAEGRGGTVIVFGTPAEEVCVGKPFMARAGAFAGVDAVLDWHPWDHNSANADACNAYFNARFHFRGRTGHGNSPWTGRSAFDAALLMGHAIEMLREHVPPGPPGAANTLNYTFSDVGPAYPNVVPDRSTVWIVGRISDSEVMRDVIERVQRCAEGAALATGTSVQPELTTASHEKVPNRTLSAVLHRHFSEAGAPPFDAGEQEYARGVQRQLGLPEAGIAQEILPFAEGSSCLSDNSEYSWFAPFAMIWVALAPAGAAWHSWVVTAAAGSSLGTKAMLVAARVLATSAAELFLEPRHLADARREMAERLRGRTYASLIPEGAGPPIDVNRATMEKFRHQLEARTRR
jgi:aminobenzoyl-glutamate utilization protein B